VIHGKVLEARQLDELGMRGFRGILNSCYGLKSVYKKLSDSFLCGS